MCEFYSYTDNKDFIQKRVVSLSRPRTDRLFDLANSQAFSHDALG